MISTLPVTRALALATLAFLLLSGPLFAEISIPKSVPAGSVFEMKWTGDKPTGRFIVLTEDGKRHARGSQAYYQADKPMRLTAPPVAGTYGVGLQASGEITDVVKFEVTAVEASLDAPRTAEINQAVEIKWTGPGYSQDIISITKAGSKQRGPSYTYAALSKDNTVKLKAPLEPGDYEVIYVMEGEVLARSELKVGGTEAALQTGATVMAGTDLHINWTGPDNSQDLISLVERGAGKRSPIYMYTALTSGGALVLTAPELLGDYDVAYFTGGLVLARAPVEVIEASATLDAPGEVVATLEFQIKWTGPGNHKDRILMHPVDADPKEPTENYTYLDSEDPNAAMRAPEQAGDYVLRYVTRGGKMLATRPLRVTPAPSEPGFLNVASAERASFGENSAVEIILDASGSMLQKQGAKRRIEIARETLLALLTDTIPAKTGFALRVFGNREADSCRTDLEIPRGPLDPAVAKAKVAGINAINLAKTPIAASLGKVSDDLDGVTGERIVILVTDGEETCDGDPALAIRQLRAGASDVRVNIVGYSIEDAALKETFESWAAVGGGQYLNAPDAEQLAKALRQALAIPFEVFAASKGERVGSGVSGGPRLTLPAGEYTVRYRWDGKAQDKPVTVASEKETLTTLP